MDRATPRAVRVAIFNKLSLKAHWKCNPDFFVAMFNSNDLPFKTRVSLLEERLSSYDEVSKQMLNKLEQAVEKISESTRDISQILIRHEERIDRANDENNAMIQLINKIDTDIRKDIKDFEKEANDKISTNTKSIEDLVKGKWIWVGAVAAASFFLGQLRVVEIFNPPYQQPPEHRYEEPGRQV